MATASLPPSNRPTTAGRGTQQTPHREYEIKLASAIDTLRKLHGEAIIRRGWALGQKMA